MDLIFVIWEEDQREPPHTSMSPHIPIAIYADTPAQPTYLVRCSCLVHGGHGDSSFGVGKETGV